MKRALVLLTCAIFIPVTTSAAHAAPSCRKNWKPGFKGEKLLSCRYRGGVRPTRQLGGHHYIHVVGTCYDYDVVVMQRCGCRLFQRSSLCCGRGRARGGCYWRVGKSRFVNCSKYHKPKFGLSGNKATEKCRQRHNAASCFKRVRKQALVQPGPCGMLRADCKGGKQRGSDFFNKKCGPLLSDCGCTVDRVCSDAKALKCYDEYSKDKAALECFWQKNKSMYDMKKCWQAAKKKRHAK